MSSRAVRKAMKRLEEQKQLELEPAKDDQVEADEDDDDDTVGTPVNPFAMLNQGQESDEEETVVPEKIADSIPSSTKKSKNKKKKRKGKQDTPVSATPEKLPSTPTTTPLDDIDRAIQEISLKYGNTPPPSSPSPNPTLSQKYSPLTVSLKYLDADIELRKLFGKVVDAEARESRRQPIHGVPARVINRIKATQTQRKATLMKSKDEWQLFSAYNKRMLSMDIVSKDGAVTKFKFVHSRGYQDVQMQFYITALGGDGNALMGLLREHPFHVDTCIQVSEMLKQQGSGSEAADLIERALFSLDCGLHPMFNVTLGTTRLPFEYFENRSFYLAVWHHLESLGRRGCWRTCLEFTKLLFAMEPEENPYAALLAIDYPAMKAREYTYLIDLRDSHKWIDETGYLLNIHYSAALAEYMLEKDQKKDHVKSSESLGRAIQQFPWLIAPLFYELKIAFPPGFPTIVPPSPLQALYTDLYIHRSKELWTISTIASWLGTVANQVSSQVVKPPPSQTIATVPMNVARHVFVMNVPALMSHVPREYTSRTQLASDPLPPENSVSPYDAPIRSLPEIARDEGAANRWIADLMRGDLRAANPDPDEEEEDFDEEQHDETFVTQLTNTFRNVFGWFGTRDAPQEEEPHDDGHGVD